MNNEKNELNNIISYNPKIEYEKEYYSEKELVKEETFFIEDAEEIDKIEKIDGIIDDIGFGVIGLPDNIKDFVSGVFDPIVDFIEDNKDFIDSITDAEEDDNINNKENEDDYEDDTEEDEEVNFIPIVNIIDKDIDENEEIRKIYKDNLVDLFDNYLNKLKSILDNYWLNIAPILIGKTLDFKNFMLTDIDHKTFKVDKERQYLLDLVMRCQIHKKTKISYASKIFPVDETLVYLRNLKLSTDLMLRYMDTDVKDKDTKKGDTTRAVLDACVINYNNKYNYTYKSMYKYLNSSIEVLDEILQLSIQEAKAKQYLKEE